MLRQFSVRRIVGFFLLDWLGTILVLLLAASVRNRIGTMSPDFISLLNSIDIAVGGVSGLAPKDQIIQFPIALMAAVLWPFFLITFSVYDGKRNESLRIELWNVFMSVMVAGAAFAGFLFFTYRETSRVMFLIFILLDLWLLLGSRTIFHTLRNRQRQQGIRQRVGVIVGAGAVGRQALTQLRRYAQRDLRVIGFLDDDPEKLGLEYDGIPVLASLQQVKEIVISRKVEDAVVALPLHAHDQLVQVCNALQKLGVHVYVIPDLFALSFPNATLDGFGGIPVIDLGAPGYHGLQRFLKRAFDVVVVSVGLIAASPLMALTALAIKLDSRGPIFYRSLRVGENGRPFRMIKFRSMRTDADTIPIHRDHVAKLIKENLSPEQLNGNSQGSLKLQDDPRITRVGKLIRKTSVDELPQIFNVLRGDMSLVGPRPPLPYEVEMYQEWHKRRLEALPGITGLWQVRGRNRVSFDEMVRMDIEYIQHQSLWLDLSILMQTPLALISAKGAG